MFLLIWLLFGIASAIVASNKGRSGFGWFLLGILLGPFGLIFALIVAKIDTSPAVSSHFPPGWGRGPLASPMRLEDPDLIAAQLDPETKICPHCAETIKFAATKCRYCLMVAVGIAAFKRQRHVPAWLTVSVFIGPFALLYLLLLGPHPNPPAPGPSRFCPTCGWTLIKGFCPNCHRQIQ